MSIIDDLLAALAEDAPVREARIGAFWTGVKLLTMTREARFADALIRET